MHRPGVRSTLRSSPGWDVAKYKYGYFLARSPSRRFDHVDPPGGQAAHAGIYRCEGCGAERAIEARKRLPSTDEHRHEGKGRAPRWLLTVAIQEQTSTVVGLQGDDNG
jgi:hypothetical protein